MLLSNIRKCRPRISDFTETKIKSFLKKILPVRKISTVLHHEKHLTVKMLRSYLPIKNSRTWFLAVHDNTIAGHGYIFS